MTDVTWNPAGDDDTSFGPLTAHNVLGGRTAADAHPAAAVSYDPAVSGLTADTVQEAIDELAESGGGAVASVNGETGVVVLDAADVGADPAGSAAAVAGDLATHEGLTTTAHGGIVASTDPRLTDARPPTAHEASHHHDGSDPLDAGDVGAVPVESVGLLPGETNRGTWDVAATYAVGDVVFETGSDLYVATAPSTGAQPSLTPGSWDVLDPTGRHVRLGPGSSAIGNGSTAIGPGATSGAGGLSVGYGATSGDFGLSVGPVATSGAGGLSVGPVATSGAGGLSVGPSATAGDYGTSVGPSATSGDYGTAVGPFASAAGDLSTAVGPFAATPTDGEVNIANIYRGSIDPDNPTTATGASIATGFVDLPETADATNPAADHQRLIARTDGLYVRDETGTEVGPLGAASSGPLTGRLFPAGWHAAPGQTAGSVTSPFTAAGDLICYPQYMWAGTYTFVGNAYYYNVGTATLRFGLYDSTGTNGGPGALVSDFGTLALVAGSGGAVKTISISLTLTTSGYYWPSILCDAYTSAPQFIGYHPTGVGPMAFVPGAALPGDSNSFSAIKRTGVATGAMPATWGTPTTNSVGAPVIRFYLS